MIAVALQSSSMSVSVRSFAKINLGLRIGARRDDGFHELLTIYQTIRLHDIIRVTAARGSGIEIRCADTRVPKDESNTCYRIAEKVLQGLKAKARIVIEIEKRLPVQGGLGGASSNAVAAMAGIETALKKRLEANERMRIAAEVGSDLPLFLVGGTVLGLGRGEQVYPLEDFPATPGVVVTPEVGVSTPKAFAEWDRRVDLTPGLKPSFFPEANAAGQSRAAASTKNWMGASTGPHKTAGRHTGKLTVGEPFDRMIELGRELSAWLSECNSGAPLAVKSKRGRRENPLLGLVRTGIKNDFEHVVFSEYPELSEVKSALERAGARYASLSGSGSALYGLFASDEAARAAAASLRKQGWAAQATATITRRQYWKRAIQ